MSDVFVSAGDASGEQHAAALVAALRARDPGLRVRGLGGPAMAAAGVGIVASQDDLAVGGLVEVLRDLGRIVGAWRRVTRALREARPELLVLVDSPDFNIPLARRAKRLGIPVLYYISPQVWAWRRGRIRKIARRVDRMAVIFPFERDVYAGTDLPVDFVGHPLVERVAAWRDAHSREDCRRSVGVESERPLVALLPGSRRNEVRDTLPLQLQVAVAVHARDPRIRFAVAVAPSIPRAVVDAALQEARLPSLLELSVHEDRTYQVVRAADAALAKPGTITVEVALLGTPLVVAARAHPFTAFLMRRLVKVPSFTMPNLIAGAPFVPEFLQGDARPEAIADALMDVLRGPGRALQQSRLAEVQKQLGSGGAADRAAAIAWEMMHGSAGA